MTAPTVVKVTEDQFMTQVLQLARVFRWRSAHFRPAKTGRGWRTAVQGDGAGFPDLVLLRNGRIVIAELKSENGKLASAQEEWLEEWRQNITAEVFCWRPSDLAEIARVLR